LEKDQDAIWTHREYFEAVQEGICTSLQKSHILLLLPSLVVLITVACASRCGLVGDVNRTICFGDEWLKRCRWGRLGED
jgi:hypothetical protein